MPDTLSLDALNTLASLSKKPHGKRTTTALTGEARRREFNRLMDLATALQHRYPLDENRRREAVRNAINKGTKLEDELAEAAKPMDPLAALEIEARRLMSKYPVTPKCRHNAIMRALTRGTDLEDELEKGLAGMHRRWDRRDKAA